MMRLIPAAGPAAGSAVSTSAPHDHAPADPAPPTPAHPVLYQSLADPSAGATDALSAATLAAGAGAAPGALPGPCSRLACQMKGVVPLHACGNHRPLSHAAETQAGARWWGARALIWKAVSPKCRLRLHPAWAAGAGGTHGPVHQTRPSQALSGAGYEAGSDSEAAGPAGRLLVQPGAASNGAAAGSPPPGSPAQQSIVEASAAVRPACLLTRLRVLVTAVPPPAQGASSRALRALPCLQLHGVPALPALVPPAGALPASACPRAAVGTPGLSALHTRPQA